LEGGWRAVFPNERHGLSVGCTENTRASQQAAEKGGASYKKGQPSGPPFSAAQLNVQPAGPP